jgi:hypothetical protein
VLLHLARLWCLPSPLFSFYCELWKRPKREADSKSPSIEVLPTRILYASTDWCFRTRVILLFYAFRNGIISCFFYLDYINTLPQQWHKDETKNGVRRAAYFRIKLQVNICGMYIASALGWLGGFRLHLDSNETCSVRDSENSDETNFKPYIVIRLTIKLLRAPMKTAMNFRFSKRRRTSSTDEQWLGLSSQEGFCSMEVHPILNINF